MRYHETWAKARKEGTLTPISSLKKGDRFTCSQGLHWSFDHDHHGVIWVRTELGDENCFAACASVLKGWV